MHSCTSIKLDIFCLQIAALVGLATLAIAAVWSFLNNARGKTLLLDIHCFKVPDR